MPIYEYRRPDGTTFDVRQNFSDEPLQVDPETGVAVERVLHAPAVHFKGKGFYNTDYGTRKRQRESASESASSSESAGSSESSGSSDGAGSSDGKAEKKDAAKAKDTKAVSSAKPGS
jgi:putative FmdB family regulatory protein